MEILATLKDDRYPYDGIEEVRQVARAILINDRGEVCLHHILGDDIFGHRDYYETPGGGAEPGETPDETVLREIREETGIEGEILCEIGEVDDDYNLIRRHNLNRYFLVRAVSYGKPKPEDYELDVLADTRFYPLEEAIGLYRNMCKGDLEILVSRRELPVLLRAAELRPDLFHRDVK